MVRAIRLSLTNPSTIFSDAKQLCGSSACRARLSSRRRTTASVPLKPTISRNKTPHVDPRTRRIGPWKCGGLGRRFYRRQARRVPPSRRTTRVRKPTRGLNSSVQKRDQSLSSRSLLAWKPVSNPRRLDHSGCTRLNFDYSKTKFLRIENRYGLSPPSPCAGCMSGDWRDRGWV